MGTAGPATRAAFPFLEFHACSFDAVIPCLRFLGIFNPADPLIACKWRNILPRGERRRGNSKCLP